MKRLALRASTALILCLCGLWVGCGHAWAQQRSVSVGVYGSEPTIVLGQDGKLSGILGELLNEIAREEHWQLTPEPCNWQQCLELAQSGAIDLLPGVTFNESRAQSLDFHKRPSLFSWSQLYSRGDSTLDSLLDLKGLRIAVLDGSIQQSYLQDLLKSFGLAAELIGVPSLQQGFEKVVANQADAVVANQRFGDFHAPQYKLQSTPIMFQPAQLFYATRKGQNADLLAAIDNHLQGWQSAPDSYYYQTLQRWGGELPRLLVPASFWWGMASLGFLLLMALAGALLLRRQVSEKTRHLQASEQRLNCILDSVEAYIYIKDEQLRYQYANRKVCELFGQPLEQVIGQTDKQFFDSTTATNLHENDRRVLMFGERVEAEEINRGLDGGTEHAFLSVKLPLRNAEGQIYALCGISTDITEHHKNLEKINQLAFYDPLTGLPNRRLLLDRLQQALAKHSRGLQQGALLFIDLDNFKDLNDTLGHDMGDRLLQQVAERLNSHVRAQDSLARLGGDEFALLIGRCQPGAVIPAAEHYRGALHDPFAVRGISMTLNATLGIALYPDHGESAGSLLQHAEVAMYLGKQQRSPYALYRPELDRHSLLRLALMSELKGAVEDG
ncbi:diguanylate cyclase domain-containing protein, partial [Pseudomonas sp.]|uniref:diguanylate cyclase domain-containing protein n=1 Tax=Pseudomonas sp. TaxID=306 RepID=UPI00273762A0